MTMAASHNLNSKYEKDARPILLSSTASYNQCADRVIQHTFKCCCFICVIITNVVLTNRCKLCILQQYFSFQNFANLLLIYPRLFGLTLDVYCQPLIG